MSKDTNFCDVMFEVGGKYVKGVWNVLFFHNKFFLEEYIKNPKKIYKVDERADPSEEYQLFHDIKKPLYPFVDILETNSSLQLIKRENI